MVKELALLDRKEAEDIGSLAVQLGYSGDDKQGKWRLFQRDEEFIALYEGERRFFAFQGPYNNDIVQDMVAYESRIVHQDFRKKVRSRWVGNALWAGAFAGIVYPMVDMGVSEQVSGYTQYFMDMAHSLAHYGRPGTDVPLSLMLNATAMLGLRAAAGLVRGALVSLHDHLTFKPFSRYAKFYLEGSRVRGQAYYEVHKRRIRGAELTINDYLESEATQ